MTVAYSVEIPRAHARTAPPYTDGCPKCVGDVVLAPVVVMTAGDQVDAIYRHRACGHEWSCCWAIWDDSEREF